MIITAASLAIGLGAGGVLAPLGLAGLKLVPAISIAIGSAALATVPTSFSQASKTITFHKQAKQLATETKDELLRQITLKERGS